MPGVKSHHKLVERGRSEAVRAPRARAACETPQAGVWGAQSIALVDAGWQEEVARRAAAKEKERSEKARKAAAAKAQAQAKVRGFPSLFFVGISLVSRRSIPRARPTRKLPKSTPDPAFPRRSTPRFPNKRATIRVSEQGDLQEWPTRVANKTPREERPATHPHLPGRLRAPAKRQALLFLGVGIVCIDANSREAARRPPRPKQRRKPPPKRSGGAVPEPRPRTRGPRKSPSE